MKRVVARTTRGAPSDRSAVSILAGRLELGPSAAPVFTFGRAAGPIYATQVRLMPGGRIGGYANDNERRWEIRGETLVLLDHRGVVTTRFDDISEIDGKLVLEGPFVPSPSVRHRLAETEALAHLPSADEAVRLATRADHVPRRNLIVMRANDRSLHKTWPRDIPAEDRSWDLALSWYGNANGFPDDPDAQHHVVQDKEGKWTALWKLLYDDSPIWNYDYVMFPDDDLDWSFSGINLAFETMRDYDLALGQPSLEDTGHVIHHITRRVPGNVLRFTSFVEVMAPIFSREALRLCGPTFGQTRFGFGIDHIWPKLLGEPRNRIAIIDQTSIVHTRPQGQSYVLGPAIEEGQTLAERYMAIERYVNFATIVENPPSEDRR